MRFFTFEKTLRGISAGEWVGHFFGRAGGRVGERVIFYSWGNSPFCPRSREIPLFMRIRAYCLRTHNIYTLYFSDFFDFPSIPFSFFCKNIIDFSLIFLISNYLYWISIDFFDFSDFFDFPSIPFSFFCKNIIDFFLIFLISNYLYWISIDIFDFSDSSDFFLISLISSWFLWFLLDSFDFCNFYDFSRFLQIPLDFQVRDLNFFYLKGNKAILKKVRHFLSRPFTRSFWDVFYKNEWKSFWFIYVNVFWKYLQNFS